MSSNTAEPSPFGFPKKTNAGGAFVEDMNADGRPDLVAYSVKTGMASVIWNRAGSFDNDDTDSSKALSFVLPLTKHAPVKRCVAARVVPEQTLPGLVCYHAATPGFDNAQARANVDGRWASDWGSLFPYKAPPYEALSIIPRKSTGGFDTTFQAPITDDIALGGGAFDGFARPPRLADPRDMVTGHPHWDLPGWIVTAPAMEPGPLRGHYPQLGTVMRAEKGAGTDGGDVVWLSMNGRNQRFVYLEASKRMIDGGNLNGLSWGTFASMAFARTSDSASVIATQGGRTQYYFPSRKSTPTGHGVSTVPEALEAFLQLGAETKFLNFSDGAVLATTSGAYRRTAEPLPRDRFYSKLRDNTRFPGLLLLDTVVEETKRTPAGGSEQMFQPFLQTLTRERVQAFSFTVSDTTPILFGTARIGAKGEDGIYIVNEGRLELMRRNDAAISTKPPVTAVTSGEMRWKLPFFETHVSQVVSEKTNVVAQGDAPMLILDASAYREPIRYVEVRDATSGSVMRLAAVGEPEYSADRSRMYFDIWGAGDLKPGKYSFRVWNASAHTDVPVSVVPPNFMVGSPQRERFNEMCGIVPSTIPGKVFPSTIAVEVKTSGSVEKAYLVDRKAGKLISVVASSSGSLASVTIPATLQDGDSWELWIRVDGLWVASTNSLGLLSKVSGAQADTCMSVAQHFNETDPTLCDDTNLYLGSVVYVDTEEAFFRKNPEPIAVRKPFENQLSLWGRNFGAPFRVRSIALEQPGEEPIWDEGYSAGAPFISSVSDGYGGGTVTTTFPNCCRSLKIDHQNGVLLVEN